MHVLFILYLLRFLCLITTVQSCALVSIVTRPRTLNVQGRKLRLSKACGTIADCTFEELCDRVSDGSPAGVTRVTLQLSCSMQGEIA